MGCARRRTLLLYRRFAQRPLGSLLQTQVQSWSTLTLGLRLAISSTGSSCGIFTRAAKSPSVRRPHVGGRVRSSRSRPSRSAAGRQVLPATRRLIPPAPGRSNEVQLWEFYTSGSLVARLSISASRLCGWRVRPPQCSTIGRGTIRTSCARLRPGPGGDQPRMLGRNPQQS